MKILTKFFTIFFLISILFQNSYSQQNMNGWFWINGQPQSNTLNWVKIIDATHYYSVGEEGTFMKSSDGGDSWLINSLAGVLDPLFGSGGTLRLYSAWFFDVNTGYVVGQSVFGDGGFIRRTTNGGETFSSINLGTVSGLTRVNDIYFINSATGYICGTSNMKAMITTNSGLNWTEMPNLPVLTAAYDCVFAKDANNIYLGIESEGGPNQRRIVRTTNAGVSWKIDTLPGSIPYSFNDIVFQNSNTGFAAGSGNGAYFAFTTNGGNNWTQAVFPNNQQGIYDLKLIGSTVYALGSYNSYYYTSNLGVTWDSVNFNDPTNINQPYSSQVYSLDINGNDAIIVGLNGKLNTSNDNGSTWRNKNYSVGNNIYGFSSIYTIPGTQKVWAGSNGGGSILYSNNGGANWYQSQTSAAGAFYEFDMINSSTGYAAGGILNPGLGYCYKTVNGGINWTQTAPLPNPGMPRYSLSFINENTGWLFGGYPFGSTYQIIKTTNGGVTWINQISNPVVNTTFGSGDMVDANTGYCISGGVFKTTNGGNNWNLLTTLPANISWNKVKAFSATTLYIGGNQRIYKSFNGGLTWDSAFIPSALPNIFNMDWTDLDNGIVVGTAGYTAKTSDGGLTWTERNPGSSTLTGVSMASKDTVYAASDRNVWGALFRLYDVNNSITVNLTVGIQGFWNGTTQVSDTVECHLRNSNSPFNEIDVTSEVLNSSGAASFVFDNAPSGTYYLEITHRNSLETWNASPLALAVGGTYSYNFTTSASQSYGNNTILTSGRYCDYSGDVTQEGSVDLNDVVSVNNASSVFTTGYVVQDVTGDNLVDLSDLIITFNNASLFVAKITP